MANTKITGLDALTTPVDADLLTIVDDVTGTATNKNITYKNIQDNLTLTASQTSDFDTEVSNNTDVTANTAKTGITSQQTTDITTNNAKVTYDDASAVASNTTHRGLTNDPHNVTATQVGLGNVSNVSTDDTAYNATSWNTNLDSATKNAIRDKVETMDTAIGLNTSKVTNVSTNLSIGTVTPATVTINSSDGTNVTLAEAEGSDAGLLSSAQLSEITANNAKVTNVSTNLSAGTLTATTIAVNSSDGTNATLVEADTTNAGILGSDKWDEIVANTSASHAQSHTIVSHSDTTATGTELNTLTGGGDTTLHDHDGISENTSARHTQNTDTALGSGAVAADHGTDSTDQIINVSYGTSATPPTDSTTTEGSLYVQYTA